MKKRASQFVLLYLFILLAMFLPYSVDAKAPKGSQIGKVPIEGKTNEEIIQQLETEITVWYTGEDIELTSDYEHFTLPRSVVKFDVSQTLFEFNEQTKRRISTFFMKRNHVHVPLVVSIDEEHEAIQTFKKRNYIDTDAVFEQLVATASKLESEPILLSYLDEEKIPIETIAEAKLEVPKLSNAVLEYAINELNGQVIEKDSLFSLLHAVNFPEALGATSQELSFLATVLYELFLQTNFDIVERHAHKSLPSYAKAGVEAEVNALYGKDFIVYNNDVVHYQLHMKMEDDYVIAELNASPRNVRYQYKQEETEDIEPRTIYRYSKWLEPGESELIQEGKKGLTVAIRRNMYDENDMLLASEVISKDVYLPLPRIVLVSTEDPEEELDVDIEEEIDEEVVEEKLDELDATLDEIGESFDVDLDEEGPGDINIVSIDQLEEIKRKQERLEAMILELEEMFLILEKTLVEDLEEQGKLLEQYYDELLEKYEQFLESLLQDAARKSNGEDVLEES